MAVTAMNHFTVLTDDLPEYGTWQLFFFDPNNARVEIDFDKSETGPANAPAGVAGAARM